jgi:Ca2+-binding EF-hand superfamily protein
MCFALCAGFDKLDQDGSGEIEIAELTRALDGNSHLGAAISAFKALDVDQNGTINFPEFLRALFPLASTASILSMAIEVKSIEMTKRDMTVLQREFEWLDADFDGRVFFPDFLARLREGYVAPPQPATAASTSTTPAFGPSASPGNRIVTPVPHGRNVSFSGHSSHGSISGPPSKSISPIPGVGGRSVSPSPYSSPAGPAANSSLSIPLPAASTSTGRQTSLPGGVLGLPKPYARDYIPSRPNTIPGSLNFQESIVELFSRSHAHQLAELKKWATACPVLALTEKQHLELETLFSIYDQDGSGTIEMDELVAHFTSLGFTEEENARMFCKFDRGAGGSSQYCTLRTHNAAPYQFCVAAFCRQLSHFYLLLFVCPVFSPICSRHRWFQALLPLGV